ncbi:MAG TPA: efflux RND transporter periplasmic adaptor subunit [Candidatus Limnocylindrales bacterium]
MNVKLLAIVALLVVGGTAVFVALGGLPRAANAATSFLTGTAAIADVSDDVAATGSIASTTTWSLAFGYAPTTVADSASAAASQDGTWTVNTVTAKVGDVVKADQVLATATNVTLSADITAATNDWTSARLQRQTAKEAYDDAVTADVTTQIRQTRSQLLTADNQVASTHQKLLDLKATAGRNRLVAPAAGIVTAVNVTAGADAPSGVAITIESTEYQVTADVVESDIASMQLGQPATVTVSAIGADLEGTVTAIAPTASSGSSGSSSSVVSYAVTVALKQPPATLRAGMTADVTITTAAASGVLAVPAAALRGTAGNYSVLLPAADGSAQARSVTVGLITSSLVEIKSGLTAGETVITGTSSTQRTTTGTGTGGGQFVVPGGGGGGLRGPGG